jgi:hypothetical protein
MQPIIAAGAGFIIGIGIMLAIAIGAVVVLIRMK